MIKSMVISLAITVALAVLASGAPISAQDKYTLKVPNGLAFAEFKGYEGWQTISISHNGALIA
jgi:cytochrome bd-type quinol oxidase subunit 2